jgi:hypothetical protein
MLAATSAWFLSGCGGVAPAEFILGTTGDSGRIGPVAIVDAISPTSDLQITGGTPVEVNWRVTATTNFANVTLIFDVDDDPNNGNEVIAQEGLSIQDTTRTLDTSRLDAGTYQIGVLLFQQNRLSVFDYTPGRLIVNQAPRLFFTSPRDNFALDRSNRITPRFDIAWQVFDPDSTVTVEIFLDPDASPNGNEIKLRESTQQTSDSFSFDLPTSLFAAGRYRILAIVSDGFQSFPFYAPGSILLRARVAGYRDLRELGRGGSDLAGAIFEGFNPRDNLGSFVAQARDLDNDGFGDFLMMAQFGKPNYSFNLQRSGIGEAYLIYGRAQRFSGSISVNSVGQLFRGEVLTGPAEATDPIRPTRGLTSFTVLADWDSDGVREFAFGIPFTDSVSIAPLDPSGYFRTGGVVVATGSVLRPDRGFPGGQVIRLDQIGMLEHVPRTVPGCPEGFLGPKGAQALTGGSSTFFHAHTADVPVSIANTYDRLGCRFSSNEFGDQFGESISLYDFDGLIMTAPNRDPAVSTVAAFSAPGAGVVSVYYNNSLRPFFPWTNVNAPPANAEAGYGGMPGNPFETWIPHGGPYVYSVDELRFGTGAGLADSPGYFVDRGDGEPCETFVDPGLPNVISTTRFWSKTPGARLGEVRGVDDFNADGLQDLLIGAPLANNGAGACFLVPGRLLDLIAGGELNLEELALPLTDGPAASARIFNGLQIRGAPGTRLGTSQDATGDFNGDGIVDIVIGSPLLNNRRGGVAVVFGSHDLINLTETELLLTDVPARGLGVIFQGDQEGDLAGARVAGVGDVDGDGLGDILIAAPEKSVRLDIDLDGTIDIDRTSCGVVYLVYGSADLRGTLNLADVGTERLPGAIFIGRNSGDFLGAGIGEQGDRSFGIATAGDVDGDGRRDLILGSVSASPRNLVRAGEAYLIYGQGD